MPFIIIIIIIIIDPFLSLSLSLSLSLCSLQDGVALKDSVNKGITLSGLVYELAAKDGHYCLQLPHAERDHETKRWYRGHVSVQQIVEDLDFEPTGSFVSFAWLCVAFFVLFLYLCL